MKTHTKSLLAASVKTALYGTTALLAVLGAQSAYAQTNETDETKEEAVEVVEVTGIRGALATAAQIKREASTFVDSISASDANALPDLSVAEALSRVPGLTVTRFTSGGSSGDFPSPEGSGNLIRGLGFVRSEFNGRDAFSANGGRALDWSAIPPQLIGGVDIYKNQSANLIEGGIGGTINLRTLEPFDNQEGFAVVSVDSVYTDLREKWSPTFSLVAGDRWKTDAGEFGLIGSFSSSELKSDINGYQAGAPTPRSNIPSTAYAGAFAGDNVPPDGSVVAAVPGFQLRTNEVDRDRDSYYFAGQWRSDDDSMEVLVKYVMVENQINSIERTTEWFPDAATANRVEFSELVVTPFTSDGIASCNGSNENPAGACDVLVPVTSGLMEEGVVTDAGDSWFGAYGVQVSNLGIGKDDYSKTDDISINVKWRAADQWYVEFDAHRTTAESEYTEQWIGSNTYLNVFTRPDLDDPVLRFSVDERLNINPNQINDGGVNQVPWTRPTGTSDPGGYFLPFASDNFRDGEGELTAFKVDFEYSFDDNEWFESVEFGARYSERDQVNREAGQNWQGVSQPWIGAGLTPLNALDSDITELVDFSDFFRGGVVQGDNTEFVYIKREFLEDPSLFYDFLASEADLSGSIYNPLLNGDNVTPRRSSDGSYTPLYQPSDISDVVEETFNAFVMLNFGTDFDNGMYLDGNIGLRYVENTLASNGTRQSNPFIDLDDVLTNPDYPAEAEARDAPSDFLPETAAYLLAADLPSRTDIKDEYWLPSLNLKLNLNDDMLLRFGASKAVTRPNIADLRASQVLYAATSRVEFEPLEPDDPLAGVPRGARDISLQRIIVNGGNPQLKSTEAVNLDFSFEWYFENGGFFTVGVFDKDIENIVQYGILPLEQITLDGTTVPINYVGQINQAEADLTGMEIAFQDFFDTLPGIWQYFGVQANYTFIDASATPPPPFLDNDADGQPDAGTFEQTFRFGLDNLLGQSEHTANLIGIYQDDDLEVRLAYNWRSEYLNSYRDFVTGNPIIQKASGFLDMSVRYDITENLNASVLIANITDEKSQSETQIDQAGTRYQRSSFLNDRRFQVGLTYRF